MLVTLAGGVGAARFLEGLVRVVPPERVVIIGNVGDDAEFYGLHICPDLDIVTYTVAGLVNPSKGWGLRGDTFQCQEMLQRFGYETWFNLGDRDLATHIYRTQLQNQGKTLSAVTADIASALGLKVTIIPSTNDLFQTYVLSGTKQMHFQEYMVRLQTRPRVSRVIFKGADKARPAPRVVRSIKDAEGVIICPSNPIVSIGAILAVRGIRSALRKTKAPIVGISPIIGGKTVKGPADKLMKSLGVEASVVGVARSYSDFLDTLIIDKVDRKLAPQIESMGIRPVVTQTIMKNMGDKVRLARLAVSEFKT